MATEAQECPCVCGGLNSCECRGQVLGLRPRIRRWRVGCEGGEEVVQSSFCKLYVVPPECGAQAKGHVGTGPVGAPRERVPVLSLSEAGATRRSVRERHASWQRRLGQIAARVGPGVAGPGAGCQVHAEAGCAHVGAGARPARPLAEAGESRCPQAPRGARRAPCPEAARAIAIRRRSRGRGGA